MNFVTLAILLLLTLEAPHLLTPSAQAKTIRTSSKLVEGKVVSWDTKKVILKLPSGSKKVLQRDLLPREYSGKLKEGQSILFFDPPLKF